MCGIAGVRKFGTTPITGEEIVLLLCSLEHRGQHATGVALMEGDKLYVHKAPDPAWQFTKSKEFEAFLKAHLTENTEVALLHTRWATTGIPEINSNNHPIHYGATAIVHNGMIQNHDELFKDPHYTRRCETDSDIIRAIIDEHGFGEDGMRALCKMRGSAAIAAVSTDSPGTLLLARSGSPLVYAFSDDAEKFYWASEAQAILKASKPFHEVRGLWVQDTRVSVSIGSMPDNTAWVFGPENLELHHLFNTCLYYKAPDYRGGRESYHSKKKRWKAEAKRIRDEREQKKAIAARPVLKGSLIQCAACGTHCENVTGAPWKTLTCPDCKASLGG